MGVWKDSLAVKSGYYSYRGQEFGSHYISGISQLLKLQLHRDVRPPKPSALTGTLTHSDTGIYTSLKIIKYFKNIFKNIIHMNKT